MMMRQGSPPVAQVHAEAYLSEPLTEKTRRYRRNILAIACGAIALDLFPTIKLNEFKPLGLPINEKAAVTIVGAVLAYNVVMYVIYGRFDWNAWSAKVRDETFDRLRMLFWTWPRDSDMTDETFEAKKRYETGGSLQYHLLRRATVFWTTQAPLRIVGPARQRVVQFIVLDVFVPLALTLWAVLIIICRLQNQPAP